MTAAWPLDARLAAEPELARSAADAAADSAVRRTDLVRDHGLTMVDGGASLSTGVGGVSDLLAVKCLHAHVAHALARPGYALGEAILAEVADPWCDDRRCAAFAPAVRRCCRGRGAEGGRGMKVAIVDLGTNTCRLFLADVTDGRVAQDARVTTVVRLGQGVDETGRLHEDAVERTHACLEGYAPRIADYGPERRLLIATSVLRDARDGKQFLKAMRYEFAPAVADPQRGGGGLAGVSRRDLVAGATGAPVRRSCSSTSAAAAPSSRSGPPASRRRSCAASTSALSGSPSASSTPTRRRRRRSRPSRATWPPPSQAAVPAELRAAVRGAVGVAGTYTTLVANKLGMTEYDARLVQGHVLSLADIDARRRPLRRDHQRRARPAAGHPARPRGRHPRRRADRPRGLPRVRPRRRPRQRGRPARGRGARPRRRLA